jgi:hypothetical protein
MRENRFYYSHKQNQTIQQLRYLSEDDDGKSNYIMTENGLDKYTEWCSLPNSKSNWDDAILVYESNETELELIDKITRK